MTQMQALTDWTDNAAPVAFWVCALWPALTASWWPWWQHQWGWNMVIKTELIALALLSTVLHREFGVQNAYVLLWTVSIAVTLIPLVVLWRTILIVRTQIDGARRTRRKDLAGGRSSLRRFRLALAAVVNLLGFGGALRITGADA